VLFFKGFSSGNNSGASCHIKNKKLALNFITDSWNKKVPKASASVATR